MLALDLTGKATDEVYNVGLVDELGADHDQVVL